MPKFKGISVSINPTYNRDSQGPFPEYGTYTQRRNSRITTYIPSSSNTAFAVSIEMDDDYKPMTSMPNESLAAYLYFDGRKQEETATLLRRGSETWISSRWVTMANGELAEKEFYFKEIGLEVFLTGLDIKKEKDSANGKKHSSDSEGEGEKATAGQIRVDLYRVVPEGPVRKGEYKPLFTENENEDVEDKNAAELEHTAGFGAPKPLYKESISVQSVSHLDAESSPYASFIFFYRGERQLQKMGVMPKGAHGAPSPTKGILGSSPTNDGKTLQGLKDSLGDPKAKRKSYSGYRNGEDADEDEDDDDDDKKDDAMDHDDDKEVSMDKDSAVDQDLTEGVRKIKLKRSLEDAADAYKRASSDTPPNSPPQNRMRSRANSNKTPSSQRRFANPSSASANKFTGTPSKAPAQPDADSTFSPAKRRRESRAMDIGSSNMISEEDML